MENDKDKNSKNEERKGQYAGIVQFMAEPDPLRLRYRDVISAVVKKIIEGMEYPAPETVDRALQECTYNPMDHDALLGMVLEEFTYIHEGNAGRYGITPSQYYKWKAYY